jgi:hypothetical protein
MRRAREMIPTMDGALTRDECREKGELGESLFQDWLDEEGFGYFHISQDPGGFARLFRDCIKRPDFLVLIDSIGLIAVDVKNRSKLPRGDFSLDYDKELRSVLAFERIVRIPVWYAYLDPDEDGSWLWISALKAVEKGTIVDPPQKEPRLPFLAIDPRFFAKIRSYNEMGLLFTQRSKLADVVDRTVEMETKMHRRGPKASPGHAKVASRRRRDHRQT